MLIPILTSLLFFAGSPNTLAEFLSQRLPLLFPIPSPSAPVPRNLAYTLIQGVLAPPEAELAWLGACMAGADGWVNVCVGLLHAPPASGSSRQ